ncbi:Ultraviolet-B receptor UVR8 [Platanthera zijinensis]|uniref:Ultraviolet-B receptor UVR8 n=1 Tax=Platanthera zijinensis TaxID=2320716 RepID=A0AAP0AVG1_9ASPA
MSRNLLYHGVILRTGAGFLLARSNYWGGYRRAASVWSFGDNSNGALGISSPLLDAYEPAKVPELPATITAVTSGHYHSLAVNADGEVWAWGRNNEGQLGRGADAPRSTWCKPERVLGLNNVKVKSAYASGVVSAVIGDDGSLWVWGRSKRGQLGLGKRVMEAIMPSKVEALSGQEISKVSFGWGHVLALTRDSKLFGWGYAENGRLGKMVEVSLSSSPQFSNSYGSLDSSVPLLKIEEEPVAEKSMEKFMPINWEPTLISELSSIDVSDVACGFDHSLILCYDGTVLSSGDNTYGQLGRDTDGSKVLPVHINFRPLSLSAGLGHSLLLCRMPSNGGSFLDEATGILSWGWNKSSQLGRKGRENVPAPVEGLEGEEMVSVSAGRVHSICLTSKGQVWTWGSGRNGRLGLGSFADEAEPTFVQYLEGFVVLQAVTGFDHNLLLVAD